jgi:hypothetical protein
VPLLTSPMGRRAHAGLPASKVRTFEQSPTATQTRRPDVVNRSSRDEMRRRTEEDALRRELPTSLRPMDLQHLSDPELRRVAQALHRDRTACGCRAGEAMTMASLIGVAVWVVVAGLPQTPESRAIALGVAIGAVVLGAVVGKLLGIAVARMRYRRLVGSLQGRPG